MCNERGRRGFTLTELVLLVAVVSVLLSLGVGTIGYSRDQSSVRADIADLREIAQASAMYSEDYQDRLFTFSWKPGEVPDTPNTELAAACADLVPGDAGDERLAAVLQQLDIASRSIDSPYIVPDPSIASVYHAPHITYNHLVLADYMGETFPSEVFSSSADRARNIWLENIEKFFEDPAGSRARPPAGSSEFIDLWRWAFSSSYVTGPSHFSNDTGNDTSGFPITPRTAERATNHRRWHMPSVVGVLGTRKINEVAHPALKVQLFDEMDRYTGQFGQYFGFESSSAAMTFYDGSAGRYSTASANYGFSPNDPDRGADTPGQISQTYFYSPIAWWDPPGFVRTTVPVYYDQTRGGLQGIDFSPGSIRKPVQYGGR